ncbi:hypothetical protein GWI33_004573 [Rhynchophorus ferrugineus]|uniref:AB hydrolase-1 domain-containing protein n=1 Tax=Rhynchophorus ferrugineus TaxID=354439 RepID=A0A834IMV2_RHYFE|nr:hypothetical protein GWI33_004573 [Rhynchophorus ferrugineus]
MGENCNKVGWWCQYSESRLVDIENKLLTIVKTAYRTWFVPIGSTIGNDDKIWTIALNEEGTKTPLVMLHGFAAGIGLWCMNFDEIAKDRPVYAIDLLGFGRSSRPNFANDCETAEQQWISTIEAWRKQLKMDKFILLGHSFGGYLATSYAINYPNRVKHLILADPWGFSERMLRRPSLLVRAIGFVLYPLTYLNPLATVRAVGPFGPWFIRKIRSDLSRKYEDAFDEKDIITEYIYHCNAQYPSGEAAFHSFMKGFGWAKNPMVRRLDKLYDDIPITVIYGEYSWIDKGPGKLLQEKKKYVNVEIIPDAGHQVYSDQPKLFNQVIPRRRISKTKMSFSRNWTTHKTVAP